MKGVLPNLKGISVYSFSSSPSTPQGFGLTLCLLYKANMKDKHLSPRQTKVIMKRKIESEQRRLSSIVN